MSSHNQATGAYSRPPVGGTSREIEAWALLTSANRMAIAQTNFASDRAEFLDAARLNWRLWTIFQAELSSPTCALPREILQNMLTLCNFVDKHMVDLLANPTPAKVDILVSINRNIAAGLLSTPESAESSAQPPQAQTPGVTIKA